MKKPSPKDGSLPPREPLRFHVAGVPAPQGSKSFKGMRRGKPILVESSAKVKPWREAVALTALAAIRAADPHCELPYFRQAVSADFIFRLPTTKAGNRSERPIVRPDLDKLIRSTCDALTQAGVWADDSLVVSVTADKWRSEEPGCVIIVQAI